MDFVHLHVHTHYSILDSTIRIPALADRVRDLGMKAVAITDHCNLFGAIQFSFACRKAKIKPIIGCEMVVCDEMTGGRPTHLVLLCRNSEGFSNLRTLVTRSYLEGMGDFGPTVTHKMLLDHFRGLTALSGCLGGEIPQLILKGDEDGAIRAIRWYDDVFGRGHFYLEVQSADFAEQEVVNEALVDLSMRTKVPLVATANAHYLEKDDALAHAVLAAIHMKRQVTEEQRHNFPLRCFNLSTPDEMFSRFRHIPKALENTVMIAEEVDPDIIPEKSPHHFPLFETPTGESTAQYLRRISEEGLRRRLEEAKKRGEEVDERRYFERLNYELDVITKLGFDAYYLIVWDFINFARQKEIPVGAGRGSGAGSLAAYCIGVTDIDPIKFDLLFERFLNPERVTPPDFDIDLCERRRDEVIEYVRKKYGHDQVGQIITFNSLGAKAAVRDVARVLGLSFAESDRISKLIASGPEMTLNRAIEIEPRLSELIRTDPLAREVIEIAKRIEGLVRQPGKHASGVVIADRPIVEYAPLYKMDDGAVVTQYEMNDLDAVGLIKFDMLGLRTLTVIDHAVRLIRERRDPNFRIEDIPLDDPKTYDMIASGKTAGVFQLEGRGITDVVKRLRPDRFEDLIALLALYRPGPLGGGMVQDFIERKHGHKPVTYMIPQLEPILRETYGVILYQEQVMRIASEVAGFTLGQADLLRRAMGKKKREELERHREPFIQGAMKRGISAQVAEQLFAMMEHFASYGFNKSHSAAYALATYRTAYLKVHYPAEYFCAILTGEKADQEEVMTLIREARAMGIEVWPPDVNRSEADFTIEDIKGPDGTIRTGIRFGISAIKGVGDAAVQAILSARKEGKFEGVLDFLVRVDPRKVNRRVVEALIKGGAFDSFGHTRRAIFESLDLLMDRAENRRAERDSGQMSLFDALASPRGGRDYYDADLVPKVEEWPRSELLAHERAALGYYLSGHPLDAFSDPLTRRAIKNIGEISEASDQEVAIAGIVVEKSEKVSKTGNKVAFATIEDTTGRIECKIFGSAYDEWVKVADGDKPVLLRGVVQADSDGEVEVLSFVVNSVVPLEEARYKLANSINIVLDLEKVQEETVERLRDLISRHKGTRPLFITLRLRGAGEVVLRADGGWSINPSPSLVSGLQELLGPGGVELG